MNCADYIFSDDYLEYVLRNGVFSEELLSASEDYCIYPINDKWILASFNIRNLPILSSEGIGYSFLSKLYGLCDLGAVNSSGVAAVREQPVLGFLGQGCYVAIIDTGINWRHSAFINRDGSTKIEVYWDQESNRIYDSAAINEALADDSIEIPSDDIGHGTFMAGIACGNVDVRNNFSGVAPLARLIVVRLRQAKQYLRNFFHVSKDVPAYSEADIILGIDFVSKYANERKMQVSYAIGVGTLLGSHTGSSPLGEILRDEAEIAGRCVSVAAGNEGNERLHYAGATDGITPDRVELKIGEREEGLTCEIWSKAPEIYAVEIISPSGQIARRIPPRSGRSSLISFLFEDTTVDVYYQLYEYYSGENVIAINFTRPASGIWVLNVYSRDGQSGTFDIWTDNRSFLKEDTYFLSSNPYRTITNPANNAACICVSAYDYRNFSVYLRAGRGYNSYDIVRPDYVAPGVGLVGPAGIGTDGYVTRSGSSVATAFYAGLAALLQEYGVKKGKKQYYRTSEIRGITIAGCIRRDGMEFPNREWGYGAVNLYNSLDAMRIE